MTQTQVPHFALHPSGAVASVTHWGVASGLIFRPGDRVLLGPASDGELLLLCPRGYGAMMLGYRTGEQLFAEPGGVPASPIRWYPAGGVLAVERQLDASAPDLLGILGIGSWTLSEQSRRVLSTSATAHPRGPLTMWCTSSPLEGEVLDWVTLSRLVLLQGWRGLGQYGLVVGRTASAASVFPARPGWVRYVLAPAAAVIASDWCVEQVSAEARSAS